eukprot:3941644-Rhodomonas_salina.3
MDAAAKGGTSEGRSPLSRSLSICFSLAVSSFFSVHLSVFSVQFNAFGVSPPPPPQSLGPNREHGVMAWAHSCGMQCVVLTQRVALGGRNVKRGGQGTGGFAKRLGARNEATASLRKQAVMSKRRCTDDAGVLGADQLTRYMPSNIPALHVKPDEARV